MASSAATEDDQECPCLDETSSEEPPTPHCVCPRGDHGLVEHEEDCMLYKNEKLIFPHDVHECECQSPRFENGVCACCACLPDRCQCRKSGREALDEWRKTRKLKGTLPAVLEANHPLMMKFQQTLKIFLEKENQIAEEEIINLRDTLRQNREKYDADLEDIYRKDHETNDQRVLIEEYEAAVAKKTAERMDADKRVRQLREQYNKCTEALEQDISNEREAMQEQEALSMLCRQLTQWREETESDLTISHRMSDKMRKEKKALAEEKRRLDMMIYHLDKEIWNLESRMDMFNKQVKIKSEEMEKFTDMVTAYEAELEDLDLDKRRLVSLWNSVLVNIRQRDNVFDSVRDDYNMLKESYHTLTNNFDLMKKTLQDEMNTGKALLAEKDKIVYDMNGINKLIDIEETKQNQLETQIAEMTESIEMCDRDIEMIKMENNHLQVILDNTIKNVEKKTEQKMKIENEILQNINELLLNDKASCTMTNGIKKMREMSRKQEINLMNMETQHAKLMLDIEVYRNKKLKNDQLLKECNDKLREKEKELEALEQKSVEKDMLYLKKQRELDNINKRLTALLSKTDKTPQEKKVDDLEAHIKALREKTDQLQQEWLRLQGHVVKMTTQHQKLTADINLINKQEQICAQKTMRIQSEADAVAAERAKVDRSLRNLQDKLQLLQGAKKDATEQNVNVEKMLNSISHEYTANLKDAEESIIQVEEDIFEYDRQKAQLAKDLEKVTKEALIWQRKGIMAVELKRNLKESQSAAGEVGKMRNEIHRMEVRREQLRRIGEKLSDDLAFCVTRRANTLEKLRSMTAVEKQLGTTGKTSQMQYHHKLRLAKADVLRVKKEVDEAQKYYEKLVKEQERLEKEIKDSTEVNAQLEEHVATIIKDNFEADKQKQWLLERVVRTQRIGNELKTAVKRNTLKVRRSKPAVLDEYNTSKTLNDRICHIVEIMCNEFPYLQDRLSIVNNTLNIHSPQESPRLIEDVCSACLSKPSSTISEAEKPLEP